MSKTSLELINLILKELKPKLTGNEATKGKFSSVGLIRQMIKNPIQIFELIMIQLSNYFNYYEISKLVVISKLFHKVCYERVEVAYLRALIRRIQLLQFHMSFSFVNLAYFVLH